jgi:hypothetical protein
MKSIQKGFILSLFLISVALYGLMYIIFTRYIIASLPLLRMVLLLFAINSLAFYVITNTKEKKPRSFVYSFMAVSFGRLFVCGAFVFIYAFTHKPDAKIFAITFCLLYFIYTTIEVRAMYAFFKS